jgi:hypothetical protein
MRKLTIDVISEGSNCVVVQMPGRRYPGLVLQGDSLRILLDSAEELCELCASAGPDASEAAAMLKEKLAGYLSAYEKAMEAEELELPYPKRP